MQTLTIDLKKNKEVADLVADMEVGASVKLHTTIKAKDDQTLTLTLDEAVAGPSEAPEEDEPEGDDVTPAMRVASGSDE